MAARTPRGYRGQPTTKMAEKHEQYDFTPRPKSPLAVARTWVIQLLTDNPLPEADVKARAQEDGIAEDALGQALSEVCDVDEEQVLHLISDGGGSEPSAVVTKEGAEVPIDAKQSNEDQFALTAEERRQYRIGDNEQPCWIREPGYWTQHAPGDPARDHLRGVPGGRVVIINGDYVRNGPDLILATVPMEHVERAKRAHQAAAQEIEDDLRGRVRKDSFTLEANKDDDRVRELAEINTAENHRLGLTGPLSPSSGLEYDEFIKNRGMKPEDVRREAIQNALGRFYSADLTDAQVKEAYDKGVLVLPTGQEPEGGRARGSGGKFISIPANVRPRNLMKPTA